MEPFTTAQMEILQKTMTMTPKAAIFSLNEIDKYDPSMTDKIMQNPEDFTTFLKEHFYAISFQNPGLNVVLRDLPATWNIKIDNIRNNFVGKLIQFTGILRSKGNLKEIIDKIQYECENCGQRVQIPQPIDSDEPITATFCPACKKRALTRVEDITKNVVIITLEDNSTTVKQIDHIDVMLTGHLTSPEFLSDLSAGKSLTVVGYVRDRITKSNKKFKEFFVEAEWLETAGNEYENLHISKEDEEEIIKFSKDPMLFNRLIGAIAPHIYGNDIIKKAILLQQFEGNTIEEKEKGIFRRGSIHILLCGDPGSGKTDLLKFASVISPKAKYVTGTSSSAIGLTATARKDDITGTWIADAGVLPLYNKGLVCLDELDKLKDKEEVAKMNEALSNQMVTVDKANVHISFPARTSVLAAANPKFGRFNDTDPVKDQLDMDDTFLDRFDLVFLMKENKKKEVDAKILEKIFGETDSKADLPIDFLRKYIAYARQNISPKLSDEAKKYIEEVFMDLKYNHDNTFFDVPVKSFNQRYVQSFIRLAEANAKVKLSNTVSVEDAVQSFELIKVFLMDTGYDPSIGQVDIDRISGTPSSQRGELELIYKVIKELQKNNPAGAYINDIREKLPETITEGKLQKDIEVLKKDGEILEPKYDYFKVL